jgi:hypothetical protein
MIATAKDNTGHKRLAAAVLIQTLVDWIALLYGSDHRKAVTLKRMQATDRPVRKKRVHRKKVPDPPPRPIEAHIEDCRYVLCNESPFHAMIGMEPHVMSKVLNDEEACNRLVESMTRA